MEGNDEVEVTGEAMCDLVMLASANHDENAFERAEEFVIDRAGIIRAVDADPDYTRRPEPAQTVEVLRRLPSR